MLGPLVRLPLSGCLCGKTEVKQFVKQLCHSWVIKTGMRADSGIKSSALLKPFLVLWFKSFFKKKKKVANQLARMQMNNPSWVRYSSEDYNRPDKDEVVFVCTPTDWFLAIWPLNLPLMKHAAKALHT